MHQLYTVSLSRPPVRKSPALVFRDWVKPAPFVLIERHMTYLVFRLVTPENVHTFIWGRWKRTLVRVTANDLFQ